MASYNVKYNRDDSIIRHIIIGLLADLNNKVWIKRQLDKATRAIVDIPFYYSVTGDDEFLRDKFLFAIPTGAACTPDPAYADGNYDAIPRGVVNLNSFTVDSGKLVNKRTRGEYGKLDTQGVLNAYSAEFEMIPITMSMDVEILISSMLDGFKVTENLVKKLYKSNFFNVEVGHLDEGTYRLPSYYSLPEDYDIQKPIDFTFEDKEKYKISLSIEVNSYIPVFEFETELSSAKRIYTFKNNTLNATSPPQPHVTNDVDDIVEGNI